MTLSGLDRREASSRKRRTKRGGCPIPAFEITRALYVDDAIPPAAAAEAKAEEGEAEGDEAR